MSNEADQTKPLKPAPPLPGGKAQDSGQWRLRLIEIAHLVSAYFMDVRYWEGLNTERETFRSIVAALDDLSHMPHHDGAILIRFRGTPTGSNLPQDHDYIILCGNVLVDNLVAAAEVKRLGIRMSHLSGRLGKAFGIFAANGISNLYLRLPRDKQDVKRLHEALYIASRFPQAVKSGKAIATQKKGRRSEVTLVCDESGQPDPNLTLLASLNHLTEPVMREMVENVSALLRQNARGKAGQQPLTVFNAIFRVRQFKEKLIRPPLEINNVQWQVIGRGEKIVAADAGEDVASYSTAFIESPPASGTAEDRLAAGDGLLSLSAAETKSVQVIAASMGGGAEVVHQALSTVYGDDYETLDAPHFGERLKQATDLLIALEHNPQGTEILDDVIDSIQNRFEDVQSPVFDQVSVIEGDALQIQDGERQTVVGKIHRRLVSLVNRFKGRSAVRRKMRDIIGRETRFESDEYEKIADHFNISAVEAEEIVHLLKECFDGDGHFKRSVFEKNIPAFSRYEKKVFELLWSYLKETRLRNDRVAFLNSLQLLIAELAQPKKAVKFLINEFHQNAKRIDFSDRNALMLSTLLIRTYNKELYMDIEITPEEVLFVKNGLDGEVTQYARWRIDSAGASIMEKMETVRRQIMKAMAGDGAGGDTMPQKFLLSLEREAHIFLALVGGRTAHAVISRSLQAYADPGRGIYQLTQSPRYASSLMQHLKVLIRCLGRIGGEGDSTVFAAIKGNQQKFIDLGRGAPGFESLVHQVISWVDAAVERTHQPAS